MLSSVFTGSRIGLLAGRPLGLHLRLTHRGTPLHSDGRDGRVGLPGAGPDRSGEGGAVRTTDDPRGVTLRHRTCTLVCRCACPSYRRMVGRGVEIAGFPPARGRWSGIGALTPVPESHPKELVPGRWSAVTGEHVGSAYRNICRRNARSDRDSRWWSAQYAAVAPAGPEDAAGSRRGPGGTGQDRGRRTGGRRSREGHRDRLRRGSAPW